MPFGTYFLQDIFELKKKLKVTEHDHLVLKKKHTMIKRKYVDLGTVGVGLVFFLVP